RFLNAGGIIGRIDYVLRLTEELGALNAGDRGSDQAWWARAYVKHSDRFSLDHHCEIFQCLHSAKADVVLRGGHPVNRVTGSAPCVIHGNGRVVFKPYANRVLGRVTLPWHWLPAIA